MVAGGAVAVAALATGGLAPPIRKSNLSPVIRKGGRALLCPGIYNSRFITRYKQPLLVTVINEEPVMTTIGIILLTIVAELVVIWVKGARL